MQIPWNYFPTEVEEIKPTLNRAMEHLKTQQTPYALIMKKGSVESCPLNSSLPPKPDKLPNTSAQLESHASYSRHDILKAIKNQIQPTDILLATTGYCGRELYAIEDCQNQFYMVGSMGCTSSLGLGIALNKPQHRVIVLDGDGAALMRLGALTTIGYERPKNLVHVLLDNQCHESTGGQSTVSHSIDFSAIASACGYEKFACLTTPEQLQTALSSPSEQLTFLHVKIKPGIPKQLPRPTITPPEVAQRLRQFLLTQV